MDEPRNSNRGIGRQRCQASNRADQHLAAIHEDEERGPETKNKNVDNSTQRLGFGESEEWAYGEVLSNKPEYAEFPMEEGAGATKKRRSPPSG